MTWTGGSLPWLRRAGVGALLCCCSLLATPLPAGEPAPTPGGADSTAAPTVRGVPTVRDPWRPGPQVAAQPGSTFAPAAIRAATDIPANELILDAPLPAVPAFDREVRAFASGDDVCALVLEDFQMQSLYSGDGGVNFAPEVALTADKVKRYAAKRSADGRVWVAMLVEDPAGGLGIRFARSDDMCQSWPASSVLVQHGDAAHGVRSLEIATGGVGRAAVIFRGASGIDPFVTATTDSGANWTSPVRLDAGVAAGTFPAFDEDAAIDPATGNIYAFFVQDRGSGLSAWYTRSTDGGTSFASEQSLDGVLAAHEDSGYPWVEVASDGGVLVALWDSEGPGHVYVLRSTDQGVTYGVTLNGLLGGADVEVAPRLATASGVSTVLLLYYDGAGGLISFRSGDHGATFDSGQGLASTAAGSLAEGRPVTRIEAVRASDGTWAVGWSDERNAIYTKLATDVFVRTSVNDGVSWGGPVRVDSDLPGAQTTSIGGLAAVGTGTLFVLMQDRRDDNGRSANVYANRSTATNPLAFGTDYRIDTDGGDVSVEVGLGPTLATDGASHVYAAFSAFATGTEADIYVAASADGGYGFATPVRVGGTAAGSRVEVLPRVAASADGKVHVAFLSDNPIGLREIRVNHSDDFGATWQANDQVLGSISQAPGYYALLDWPGVELVSLAGGTVYVAWSDQATIFFARSIDGGQNWSVAAVDQDPRTFDRAPKICAEGDRVVLVWLGADEAFLNSTVWGIVSDDRGQSWSTRVQLRPEGVGGGTSIPALACDGSGHAVAVWSDARGAIPQLFSNRYDGTSWGTDTAVAGPAGVEPFLPVVIYPDASNAIVAHEGGDGAVYVSRSTDGGATFSAFQRVDDALAGSSALSLQPRVAADGSGNLWVAWLDEADGLGSFFVRHSGDGGASFAAPQRLDRATPLGGSESFYFPIGAATPDTLPGAAFFVWAAERESFLADVLYNVFDLDDMDRDGYPASTDCDDTDPDNTGTPPALTGVALSRITGGVRVSWPPRPGETTDVAGGDLSALRGTADYSAATCLSSDMPGDYYDDLDAPPPPGEGRYYLLRRRNTCGVGTFGDAPLVPDPRDALDAGSTCD